MGSSWIRAVQALVEAEVIGRNGLVLGQPRHVGELSFRWVVFLRQRVDLEVAFDSVGRFLDALFDVATHEIPHAVGPRFDDEVAVGHFTLVAGGQDQILAALALVGAGRAHIRRYSGSTCHPVRRAPQAASRSPSGRPS